jgi:hypothetical protein
MKRFFVTLLFPCALLLPVITQAFVGGIAVSIGRSTNVEGAEIAPFSADAQIETEENQMTSRVFYKDGKVRDEVDMGGMQMITIQRYDEGKVWMLIGQGMYSEAEIGGAEQAPDYKLIERTVQGKEDVNGMTTTKYKTVYEGPDGRFGGFTWFTDDNIAVKGFMVSETKGEKQRIKWIMSNVKRGDQPDSLFELPAGAKPMGLMNMGLMGAMGGMGSADPSGGAAQGQTGVDSALGGLLSKMGMGQTPEPDAARADESTGDEGTENSAEKPAENDANKSMQESVTDGLLDIFGS